MKKADEGLEFVVVASVERAQFVEEINDRIHVVVGVGEDLGHLVVIPLQWRKVIGEFIREFGVLLFRFVIFPELTLAGLDVFEQLAVANLPFLELLSLMLGLAVDLDEREQLEHEILAGLLESNDGTLKALQEPDANEADNASLASFFKIDDGLLVALEIRQRIIGGEGEERFVFRERNFQFPEQVPVGFLNGIGDDFRRLLDREKSGL